MDNPGVIGCGTMGHSIALAAAWAGLPVKLFGMNSEETNKAQLAITDKLTTLAGNGLLGSDTIEQVMNRIGITHSMEEIATTSSFIIEAIPEDIHLKKRLFGYLDKLCSPGVVLATNTSGLSPSMIASGTLHPERVVACHFWNPPHLLPLVEVIRGEKTSDQTVKRAFDLLMCMNKKPIEVKKEVPGFVGNRLQFALFREAQYILEEGIASKEDIDAAVMYGIGRRLAVTGPFVSADMGGLDVFSAIADYLFDDLSDAKGSSASLKKLVADRKFGAKSGEGYYKWDQPLLVEMNEKREKELIHFLTSL